MATRGPAAAQIVLTEDERPELEGWTRRRTSAAGLALRAKIVLTAAETIQHRRCGQSLSETASMPRQCEPLRRNAAGATG
jgi:hypothetical protein